MKKSQVPERWYCHSFAEDYSRIYRHRDDKEASKTIDAVLDLLPISLNAYCLDVACGFGRHLYQLRQRGIQAYGIDLSMALLQEALRRFPLHGYLVQADMRYLPFGPSFDFVLSFFSSFGYFREDRENIQVMRSMARILKPKGWFLIDYLNPDYIKRHFIHEDHQEYVGFSVYQRRWINLDNQSVDKKVYIEDKDGRRVYYESVKLYTLTEMKAFCQKAGLRVKAIFSDYQGRVFDQASSRMIILGEKA